MNETVQEMVLILKLNVFNDNLCSSVWFTLLNILLLSTTHSV